MALYRFIIFGWMSVFLLPVLLQAEDEHEEAFTYIYDHAVWGCNEKGEGHSGWGSLLSNTGFYMDFLEWFMQAYHIQSIVDVGCGDWEFSRYINWSNVQYIGYDVVASVIEKNRQSYLKPNVEFIRANFLKTNLPSADLLVCKHVLQHLTNEDVFLFLEQLSKFKYCLITNQVENETLSSDNEDIFVGNSRKLDLAKPPFSVKGIKVLTYDMEGEVHQVFLIDNTKNGE